MIADGFWACRDHSTSDRERKARFPWINFESTPRSARSDLKISLPGPLHPSVTPLRLRVPSTETPDKVKAKIDILCNKLAWMLLTNYCRSSYEGKFIWKPFKKAAITSIRRGKTRGTLDLMHEKERKQCETIHFPLSSENSKMESIPIADWFIRRWRSAERDGRTRTSLASAQGTRKGFEISSIAASRTRAGRKLF